MDILIVLYSDYCIKQKSGTVKATKKFIANLALYGKIKIMRTDNGGEYIFGELNVLLIKNNTRYT